MRAMDCVHDDHEDIHFTAADDDELLRRVKEHRDEYHPAITDEQISELVATSAYDE
jgi:predicted small metal-binding protein